LQNLSKRYLKELIRQCKYNETVCENCWSIVKIAKGINDHTLVKNDGTKITLCKKRSISYRLQELVSVNSSVSVLPVDPVLPVESVLPVEPIDPKSN
jgi:hypothetical protein